MHKLLVFDLDGTLAPLGKGMDDRDILKLKALEQSGYRIAVCSGKPAYYLCGFMRQIGLSAPILVGENGAVIQFGVALPPREYYTYPCSQAALSQLKAIRQMIDSRCPDRVWYQPNEVCLTPFPKDEAAFAKIQDILDSHSDAFSEVSVYRHCDSFDLAPRQISKFHGLQYLARILNLAQEDFIAIGDGVNDIPMFEFADISICISGKLDYPATYVCSRITEALNLLLEQRL